MFGTIVYNLTIAPIVYILELIYSVMDKLTGSPIVCIIALSIVVNVLCLPMYKRADSIQEEERLKQESMSKWVMHIKKTFKGDERYMMLSTYYRQQNYNQLSALKSSVSLLLQIPFFLAAYSFLSNLEMLKGASFWIFNNLGAPDALFNIGSFQVNILPIIMTLINVVSAYIYLKGMPISQKIQTYVLAAVFLVILYNSPSGLVIYWTCNQIFSLVKNIFFKLIKNKKILGLVVSILGIIISALLMIFGNVNSTKKILFVLIIFIACQIPLIVALIKKKENGLQEVTRKQLKNNTLVFFLSGILLTIFIGAIIPLTVISSSPSEFISIGTTPKNIIMNNISLVAGIVLVWFSVFYFLASANGKRIFSYIEFSLMGVAIVNFFFFGKNLGFISEFLVYDALPEFSLKNKLLNLIVDVMVICICVLVLKFLKKIPQYIIIVLIAGAIGLLVTHTISINTQLNSTELKNQLVSSDKATPKFELSKTGKNVIFIMMDRAISGYIPFILNEKPELAKQLDGFIYYPNTISFGPVTYIASPALFGGYDYTPQNINKRDDELLGKKHNEALSIMPYNFNNAGYQVTVCDLPYPGGGIWARR